MAPIDMGTIVRALTLLSGYEAAPAHSQTSDQDTPCHALVDRQGSEDAGATSSVGGQAGAIVAVWSTIFIVVRKWRGMLRALNIFTVPLGWFRRQGCFVAMESSRDLTRALSIVCICLCDLCLLAVRRIPNRLGRRIARKAVLRLRNRARMQDNEDVDDQPQISAPPRPQLYRPLQSIQQGGYYRLPLRRHRLSAH
eukprot:2830793-Amphidinium_carterae.2